MKIPGLAAEQLDLVKSFFPNDCAIKLFGSRVKGNFRPNSDLDVCILSDIPRSTIASINELFEESNLPFTVEIVLYADCSEDFKEIIDATGVLI